MRMGRNREADFLAAAWLSCSCVMRTPLTLRGFRPFGARDLGTSRVLSKEERVRWGTGILKRFVSEDATGSPQGKMIQGGSFRCGALRTGWARRLNSQLPRRTTPSRTAELSGTGHVRMPLSFGPTWRRYVPRFCCSGRVVSCSRDGLRGRFRPLGDAYMPRVIIYRSSSGWLIEWDEVSREATVTSPDGESATFIESDGVHQDYDLPLQLAVHGRDEYGIQFYRVYDPPDRCDECDSAEAGWWKDIDPEYPYESYSRYLCTSCASWLRLDATCDEER